MDMLSMQGMDNTIKILMSNYFKRKRRECGLTGKQVGELLNISQQHISRYERCETTISLSAMLFFLKSQNYNVDDFFNYLLEGVCSSDEKIDKNDFEHILYKVVLYQK